MQPQPELDVAEQAALGAARDLRAIGELARLADVVDDRRAQQQVAVQPRMQRAQLERERRDGDRVLEQPAEVRVVGAWRAPGRLAGTEHGARRSSARSSRSPSRPPSSSFSCGS